MLGTIIGGGNALALLQKQLGGPKAKDAKAGQAEDRKAAADESTRRAQEALDAVKAANQGRKAQRKAAAKEKLERLKKELEALRLASAMGDPKAVARRAKQIARELAAAAREYAAGGGVGGGGVAGGGTDGVGATASGADAGAAGEADAQAKDQSGAADAGAKAAEAGGQAGAGAAKDAAVTPEEQRRRTAETFQKIAAHMAEKGGEAIEDTKVAAEMRQLMQQVKALMAQQRRRAELLHQDDGDMERLSRSVRDAGNQMEMGLAGGAGLLFAPVDVRV